MEERSLVELQVLLLEESSVEDGFLELKVLLLEEELVEGESLGIGVRAQVKGSLVAIGIAGEISRYRSDLANVGFRVCRSHNARSSLA